MTDDDQLTSVRELLRDALELARSAAAGSHDGAASEMWARSREQLATMLSELDDFASRRGTDRAS